MKAAVYYETGKPDVFRYEEVPDPVCAPGGVVIDVKAVSIEGGDLGRRSRRRRGGAFRGGGRRRRPWNALSPAVAPG